jgi:meso-butanediol dehydrogenase / (S,S)-butanediol dehydrogenase / diacetyl reductase
MESLVGKVALITGAGRGFGRGVAEALAQRGADVVLVSRNLAELHETAEAIYTEFGKRPIVVRADVSQRGDVATVQDVVVAAHETVDIIVNAAAVYGPVSPIETVDPDDWIDTLTINLIGAFLIIRAFVGPMIERGYGRVINVSSSICFLPPDSLSSAYVTSKVALNQLTRHLAVELEGTGVAAVAIHPGSLKTEMWRDIKKKAETIGQSGGLKRWADAVEQSGGDPIAKGVDVVLRAIDADVGEVNGKFCWPEDAIDKPVPTW